MCSIIGHRGAITFKPENTISSIIQLKDINCCWIEADVVLTKDKFPIMFHDESLDRLTKSKGLVRDYNYDEIKDLNINNTNEKIPLLKDFVDKCHELSINIFLELKAYNNDEIILVNKVVDIIRNIKNIQIIPCSYSLKILEHLSKIYMYKNISYIFDKIPDMWYEYIKKYKCYSININYDYNDIEDIKTCANLIPTYCFTINDTEKYNELRKINVKGIITDKPEIFLP